MINQLFLEQPDLETIYKIINALGFDNLYSNKKIFKSDLDKNNVVTKFSTFINDIKDNYINSKQNFCTGLTSSKCITIARQHLKTIKYDLLSEIVYIAGKRHTTYRILKSSIKKNIKNKLEFTISFD